MTRLQRRLEHLLDLGDDELFREGEGGTWSPAQHLYHVSLANEFSLDNVLALVRETGALRKATYELVAEAEVLLGRGRLPRGTRAPRFVTPPQRLTRDGLQDVVGGSRSSLEQVGDVLEQVGKAPQAIPHQALGPLTASRWLRFARVHSVHHLTLLRERGQVASLR